MPIINNSNRVRYFVEKNAAEYEGDFKFIVDTTKAGSASNTFILPLNPAETTYDFDVYWGDSSTNHVTTNTNQTHVYASPGVYQISIRPRKIRSFPSIYFNNAGDRLKIMNITQWGGFIWKTFFSAFWNCNNLVLSATDNLTARTEQVTVWNRAFTACTSITSFPPIDMGGGTNFTSCWNGCTGLAGDGSWIGGLDFSNGTNFTYTWVNVGLTQFPFINLSNGTKFFATFADNDFTTFPLLDFSNGTDFTKTWEDCNSLTSFPHIDTSKGTLFLSTWDKTTSLTTMPPLDFTSMLTADSAFSSSGLVTHPNYVMPVANSINMTKFFEYSAISDQSYSDFLIALEAVNPVNTGTLSNTPAKYLPPAAAARTALINRGWVISDEGPGP
jgi:hypothetical protein